MRLLPVLLACAVLGAGESETPTPTPAVPRLRFVTTSSSMSLAPDRPSEASGVQLDYESVQLACDRLSYRLSAFPGATRPVLETADLLGGPDGRVLFDSSRSTLAQIPFHGLLRPTTLSIRRQPADPARPGEVRFLCEAADLGDVVGSITTPAGPRLHIAWAERAVLAFTGTADAGAAIGMATPRLSALHFYGRAQPFRLATVLRLRKDAVAEPPSVEARLAGRDYGMRVAGRVISLLFDEAGGMQTIDGVEESEVLDGEDIIPLQAPTRPVLGK